jgi:hypothetical protein
MRDDGDTSQRERLLLSEALARAHTDDNYDSSELRQAVDAFAGRARANGVPPEQFLVDLKRLVASHERSSDDGLARRALTARLVSWGVTGYFGRRPTPGGDRGT